MASFDSDAFDTDAFSVLAFDFTSVIPVGVPVSAVAALAIPPANGLRLTGLARTILLELRRANRMFESITDDRFSIEETDDGST